MLNIIKEKLDLIPDLEKGINWAKNYTSTPIMLLNGHLIKLEPSNLAYVDPHKVIVNELKRKIEENVNNGEKMQIELTPTAGNEEFY